MPDLVGAVDGVVVVPHALNLRTQQLVTLLALWASVRILGASTVLVVVHHSDRGTQYTSIRYTERLAAAG